VTPSKDAESNFVHLQQHRHNGVTGNGRLTTHKFLFLGFFSFDLSYFSFFISNLTFIVRGEN
jgi:hypothetical protein